MPFTLESLRKDIAILSDDELAARIQEIRNRRASPKELTAKKRSAKKKTTARDSIQDLLAGLNANDIAQLLAKLGG
jgi:hypothetical protein